MYVPLVLQVPRRFIGTDAFQETPITEITRAITKHNYLVMDIQDLPRVIKEAFYLAASGRPGPVLVDVPKDIQQQLAVPDWDQPMSITGGSAGPPVCMPWVKCNAARFAAMLTWPVLWDMPV